MKNCVSFIALDPIIEKSPKMFDLININILRVFFVYLFVFIRISIALFMIKQKILKGKTYLDSVCRKLMFLLEL